MGPGRALARLGPGPTWALGPLGPWAHLGPGPTWALGPWPTWAVGPLGGEGGSKNDQKNKVLRTRFSIAEHVRTSCDIVLVTSRGLQLPYREKSKKEKRRFLSENSKIPCFTVDSVWGLLLVSSSVNCTD